MPISLYVMITGELVELSYYCIVGTVVDVCVSELIIIKFMSLFYFFYIFCFNVLKMQYDRFYTALITCDWNLYPKSSQNAMIFLLNMAKKPNKMNVAGIIPLNMNTYVVVSLILVVTEICIKIFIVCFIFFVYQ